VSRDQILWTEGFGYRDKLRTARVDTNTMCGVLSIAKPITVTGLMMAVQEGLSDLDVPIKQYLPEFTVHTRFPEDPMSESRGYCLHESCSGWAASPLLQTGRGKG